MGFGVTELILIAIIVFVIFGAGKLPKVMGDLGKGIKTFKEAIKDEDKTSESKPSSVEDKSN
ncbi:MAG: twin-arginine translocase TatA/TatE family subunit [Rickettsiales bacterium]|nr:twin-arginine translocase TatA/TatE family subunit [Rickettsiales bacterium]